MTHSARPKAPKWRRPRRAYAVPLVVAAVLFLESVYTQILAPLIPYFREDLGAGDGQIGVLVAAYAFGLVLGGLAALFVVDRVGVRRTVAGALAIVAVASAPFGFVESTAGLTGLRVVQGIGGALAWTGAIAWAVGAAPPDRRGRTVGAAVGFSVAGIAAGPAVGGAAVAVGLAPAFLLLSACQVALAVAVVGAKLAAATTAEVRGAPSWKGISSLRSVLLVLVVIAAWTGAFELLIPLRLIDVGGGAAVITAVFVVAALGETVIAPVAGRLADRYGPTLLVRGGLLCAPVVAVAATTAPSITAVSLMAVASWFVVSFAFVPAISHASSRAESVGIGPGRAWAIVNITLAAGAAAGAAASGGLAEQTSVVVPLALFAVACILIALLVPVRGGPQPGAT